MIVMYKKNYILHVHKVMSSHPCETAKLQMGEDHYFTLDFMIYR